MSKIKIQQIKNIKAYDLNYILKNKSDISSI